jgi:hypothetical protein
MRTTGNVLGLLVVALAAVTTPAAAMAELRSTQGALSQDEEKKKDKPADQQVTGSVADRDGKPVERAQVVFDGPKKATLLTDAGGRFTFNGPPGEYTITVRAGARSASFTRTIEGNQLRPNATLTIEPEEPPQ